jgi:hypothetical protein
MIAHLIHGPHFFYAILFAVAIFNAIRSCFADVFFDGTESAPTDEALEKLGWKATKITRPIMVVVFLLIAAFAVWKVWQP